MTGEVSTALGCVNTLGCKILGLGENRSDEGAPVWERLWPKAYTFVSPES